MSAGLYLGRVALGEVEAAQAVMDAHVQFVGSGRCGLCDVEWPCASATAANAELLRYGRLPKRRPGRTRNELGDGFSWLAA